MLTGIIYLWSLEIELEIMHEGVCTCVHHMLSCVHIVIALYTLFLENKLKIFRK
jgi:hypothetical protein